MEGLRLEGISGYKNLKVLTAREARAVYAVAETMFPPNGALATTINDAEVLRYVDTLLASLPFKERCLIRCLFTLFEVQMVVTQPLGAKRFSKASLKPALAHSPSGRRVHFICSVLRFRHSVR